MKRKAIILAAVNEGNPIQGVYFDLVAFASFLQTNLGGAWDEDEIVVQKTPTRSQILARVNSARDADYSLFFFAGHGETVKTDLPWPEVRMQLDSNESITERELNTGSSSELSKRLTLLQAGVVSKYREKWEEYIKNNSNGIVEMVACSKGEAAGEDPSAGGYYTSLLSIISLIHIRAHCIKDKTESNSI
jgi:hypothetical protein